MTHKSEIHVKNEIPWKFTPIELPFKQSPKPYVSFQNLETTAVIPLSKVGFTFDPRLIPPELLHITIPPPPVITIPRSPSSETSTQTEQTPVLPDFSLIKTPRDPRRRKKLFSPRHFKDVTQPLSIEIPENKLPLLPRLFSFHEEVEVKFPLFPRLLKICRKEEESPYTSPSAIGSLEEGEIRDIPDLFGEYQEFFDFKTESPLCSNQLKETKTVRFNDDLSPPKDNWVTDQAESEVFEIPFQGTSVGRSNPPFAVFGRPLPRTRPEQLVSISKKLDQPFSTGRKGSSLILSPVAPLTFPERDTRSATPPFKHKYSVQNPEFRHIKVSPELEIPIPKRFKTHQVEIIPSPSYSWMCKCKTQGLCNLCYSGFIRLNLEIIIKCGDGGLTIQLPNDEISME